MDEFIVLLAFAAFCYGIYKWAESKGRSAVNWTILAVLFSPLVVGFILLFVPKTIEKQAEEAKKLKSLIEE